MSQMESELTRVIAQATLLNEPLTLDLARLGLSTAVAPAQAAPLTIEAIIRATAAFRQLDPAEIIGRSRTRPAAATRHLAIFLASRHSNLSLAQIGRSFDNRDHTTVMHSIRRMQQQLSTDARLRADAEAIIQIASSTLTQR